MRSTERKPLARDAMAFVLAGGRGSRLMELTDNCAKPALYFGGMNRIIDFALSNAINSGIRRIGIATQYKAHSLIRHMQRAWDFMRSERNESFDILPASQRIDELHWYEGTADAVYQNINIIESYAPKYIVILAADHVYKMDYELMLRQHVDSGADVTIGCLVVPRKEAIGFGVMAVDAKDPPGIPGDPDFALASMGIYVFDTAFLFQELRRDAATPSSKRDFGNDIIPYIVNHGKAVAHRFTTSCIRAAKETKEYWRDVGTLDAYFEANLDLTDVVPRLNMYDRDWPIWTDQSAAVPAKYVHDEDGRRGHAISSPISQDCIVSGAVARRSLLSAGVTMGSHSSVEEAVILPHCNVGRGARLTRVIIDSGVRIPEGLVVGEDPELDARRFRRTESGVCLITRPMIERLDAGRHTVRHFIGGSTFHQDRLAG
jgi:glucose-1-phosphate adenylyltransferase